MESSSELTIADRLQSPNKVSALSFSEDEKKALNIDSYSAFLKAIKIDDGEPCASRDDLLVDEWSELQGESPPVDATKGSAERRRTCWDEKQKRKSDEKKEGLVDKESPDEDEENKPPIESSPAKGAKYLQAFKKALDFLKDVKRELVFTNPNAYQLFLDIFEKSKRNREDQTDRLRVVAEAKEVIGHRQDLMQRLVEFAMSDLPVDKPLRPLQPLVAAADRGGKPKSGGC